MTVSGSSNMVLRRLSGPKDALRPRVTLVSIGVVAVLALALAACRGGANAEPLSSTSEAVSVCPNEVVEGLDVYDGQGTIDWTQVAASGRAFAFIKVTQGNYNTQSTLASYWSGAKAAGILRSPYHFFDPTIDGVTQAQYFLAALAAQGGLQPGDLPPMLDIECPTSSTQSSADPNCEYSGNSGWAPTATIAQGILAWLNAVEQGTGRTPIVYSYPDWFADVAFTDPTLAQYPLFIATYGTCANVPAPWTSTVFWQYSATGTVPGVSGQADVDRFVGTQAQLLAFANGGTQGGMDAAASDASGRADATSQDAGAGQNGDAGSARDAGSSADAAAPESDSSLEGSADHGNTFGQWGSDGGVGCGMARAARTSSGWPPIAALVLALVLPVRLRRRHG